MPSPARISSTGTSSGSNCHRHTTSVGWNQWLPNPTKEIWCWGRLARRGRRAARNHADKAGLYQPCLLAAGPGSCPSSRGRYYKPQQSRGSRRTLLGVSLRHRVGPCPAPLPPATTAWDGNFNGGWRTGWTSSRTETPPHNPPDHQHLRETAGTSGKHIPRSARWETPNNAEASFFPPHFIPSVKPKRPLLPCSRRWPEGAAGASLNGRALPPPQGCWV